MCHCAMYLQRRGHCLSSNTAKPNRGTIMVLAFGWQIRSIRSVFNQNAWSEITHKCRHYTLSFYPLDRKALYDGSIHVCPKLSRSDGRWLKMSGNGRLYIEISKLLLLDSIFYGLHSYGVVYNINISLSSF